METGSFIDFHSVEASHTDPREVGSQALRGSCGLKESQGGGFEN